jgi:hypothetical protein
MTRAWRPGFWFLLCPLLDKWSYPGLSPLWNYISSFPQWGLESLLLCLVRELNKTSLGDWQALACIDDYRWQLLPYLPFLWILFCKAVILIVWSLDQENGLIRKWVSNWNCDTSTPDLLNQLVWEVGPDICSLTSLPGHSQLCSTLRTTTLNFVSRYWVEISIDGNTGPHALSLVVWVQILFSPSSSCHTYIMQKSFDHGRPLCFFICFPLQFSANKCWNPSLSQTSFGQASLSF